MSVNEIQDREKNKNETVPAVSLVILTFNRSKLLRKLLESLSEITYKSFEVIVVDNHSEDSVEWIVDLYEFARLIQMDKNLGVAGRNRGIEAAHGDIIITLDDDVSGITDADIKQLITIFQDASIGAVCFKVLDEETGQIINWCHHRKQEEYSERSFITEEITEGAVAFRSEALELSGLYPEEFFISHEGPDLALRIMNGGYKVIYIPDIIVRHSHSTLGRASWRRYYYDTRNQLWLVLRNYPLLMGVKSLTIGLGAMAIYALRDGFFRYWLKGIMDGIKGSKRALEQRSPMGIQTHRLLKEMAKYRPGIWYMVKKRFLDRGVRI